VCGQLILLRRAKPALWIEFRKLFVSRTLPLVGGSIQSLQGYFGVLCLNNRKKTKGVAAMSILKGKKVIVIGDRDGIPGPAIDECVKTAGGEVVFSSTECFV